MARESLLVKDLDIKTRKELKMYSVSMTFESKKVAIAVIFDGKTYEQAGEKYEMTKHAVYEMLKRLYFKKYGVKYGENKS